MCPQKESFAESLKESNHSGGDPEHIDDVPGVRQTPDVLEKDAKEQPVGQSPTNWSRYGSGTHDYGKDSQEIADRRARGARVDG